MSMADYKKFLAEQIEESRNVLEASKQLGEVVSTAAMKCVESLKNGGTIFICGNGGSAADAQHIAAELINRYKFDRRPLACVALTTDSSNITAIGNDSSFEYIYSKQVEALARKGDVLISLSTSGNSKNILAAIHAAHKKGVYTIGLTGKTGGQMRDLVGTLINIPSNDTARIQESHHVVYHVMCDIIERECA